MKKIFLTSAFLLSVSLNAFAASEDGLAEFYKSTIWPFFNQGTVINMAGEKGINIHGYEFLRGSTAIVVVPGWGEPARKYAEIAYDLTQAGYSVFIIDHRGQGESERILKTCVCSYVESYHYYTQDLANFITNEVKNQGFARTFILAHSMGGGISARMLLDNPGIVDGAVLSSPMLQIITKPYPQIIAQALEAGAVLVGDGKGRRLFDKDKPEDFDTNIVTHSLTRWTINREIEDQPGIETGYATNNWLNEMFKMTDSIGFNHSDIGIPVLMFQSSDDHYVVNSVEVKKCGEWSRCQLVPIPNTKHEILMEKDEARNQALSLIKAFIH